MLQMISTKIETCRFSVIIKTKRYCYKFITLLVTAKIVNLFHFSPFLVRPSFTFAFYIRRRFNA